MALSTTTTTTITYDLDALFWDFQRLIYSPSGPSWRSIRKYLYWRHFVMQNKFLTFGFQYAWIHIYMRSTISDLICLRGITSLPYLLLTIVSIFSSPYTHGHLNACIIFSTRKFCFLFHEPITIHKNRNGTYGTCPRRIDGAIQLKTSSYV
jgi:hypothetical protein